MPDHPLLAGLDADHLRDWRGEATLLPPRLQYTLRPRYGPTVQWCGIDVPRPWRCGCRGNVASVLIEKPARGDFLPILDGGYDLQYSPLLEYREGKGMVLFCQVDVTGRTESEPAADALTRNLLGYVSAWKPQPNRKALYVGDAAGKAHLEAAGLSLGAYAKEELTADRLLIVGPGGGKVLAGDAAALGKWLKDGGHVLALGLDEADATAFLPSPIEMKKREHIAAYFAAPGAASPLAGVGPADVFNRDPRELSLVVGGADGDRRRRAGDGRPGRRRLLSARSVAVRPDKADEPQADIPVFFAPGDAPGGEPGGGRGRADSAPLSRSRAGVEGRKTLAARPLSRRAGGMGRSVSLFPVVIGRNVHSPPPVRGGESAQSLYRKPLAPRGRGVGGEGESPGKPRPPHPQPLSPEGRGEP